MVEQNRHDVADLGARTPRDGNPSEPQFDFIRPDIAQQMVAPFWDYPAFQVDLIDALG